MATGSVIAAVMSKFDALTAANFPGASRPSIYLDEAPQVDGTQVRPPYVVLRDRGTTPAEADFERHTLEVTEFTLEIYYAALADCDTAAQAVKLNGGTRAQAQGFDYGTLSDLSLLSRSTHSVVRTAERRRFAGVSLSGARTHAVELDYRVTVKESS